MATNYQAMTTVTAGTSTLTVTALINAIKTLISANSAWSVVEDVVPSTVTTTSRFIAFKNDHTVSGLANDFYVLLYVSGPTTPTISMGEAYNSTTHTLSGCSPALLTSCTPDASGRMPIPATVAINASTGAVTTTGTAAPLVYAVGSSFTTLFWMGAVYTDHLIFGYGSTAPGVICYYAGGYTSLVPTAATNDPFNICLATCGSTSINGGTCPREPLQVASLARTSYATVTSPISAASGDNMEYMRGGNSGSGNFDYYQQVWPVSRIYLTNSGNTAGVGGYNVRGIYNNMIAAAALPPSLALGDTVIYNSTSWAYVGTGVYFDSGAP